MEETIAVMVFSLSLRAKLKRRGGEETYVGVQLRFWGGVKKGKLLLWNFCEKKCKRRFPRHFFLGGGVHEVLFPFPLPPPTSLGDQTDTLLKAEEGRRGGEEGEP